jgi:hypothetical protein
MRKHDRNQTKLNLGKGFLADKLAADSEMNADLSKFLQRRQLDDPRIRIMHDPRRALASPAGSEQLVFWSLYLFAHKS